MALLLGGFIYLFLRQTPVVFQRIVPENFLIFIKEQYVFEEWERLAPDWLKYNIPDMLWMFAFTLGILTVWDFKIHRQSLYWLTACFVSGVGYELLQCFSMIPGFFDWNDLLFILLGSTVPLITIFKIKRDEKYI